MSSKQELVDILMDELPEDNPWYGHVHKLVDALISRGVIVKKVGNWILRNNGSATCDQCNRTQKDVWDMDTWQRYCGCCGAEMVDAYSADNRR